MSGNGFETGVSTPSTNIILLSFADTASCAGEKGEKPVQQVEEFIYCARWEGADSYDAPQHSDATEQFQDGIQQKISN